MRPKAHERVESAHAREARAGLDSSVQDGIKMQRSSLPQQAQAAPQGRRVAPATRAFCAPKRVKCDPAAAAVAVRPASAGMPVQGTRWLASVQARLCRQAQSRAVLRRGRSRSDGGGGIVPVAALAA